MKNIFKKQKADVPIYGENAHIEISQHCMVCQANK
jgi:hypothetical protein